MTEGGCSTGDAAGGERPCRLLVVEDEPLLREAICSYLEFRGFEVVRTGSLSEARHHLVRMPFCAAIVDVGLPDGDGLTLLRHAGPERAMVISAVPDESRYARMGVVWRLDKPLDLHALDDWVVALPPCRATRASR